MAKIRKYKFKQKLSWIRNCHHELRQWTDKGPSHWPCVRIESHITHRTANGIEWE
jgi:hypothetical protein